MMRASRIQWLRDNADRVAEYKRRSAKKAYHANPIKFRLRQKNWRIKNSLWVRMRDAKYRQKYADKRRHQFSVWRKLHRCYYRVRHDADVANLANWYVRAKLSRKSCVKPSEWPEALVNLMRAQLKVKRLCHNQKTSKN